MNVHILPINFFSTEKSDPMARIYAFLELLTPSFAAHPSLLPLKKLQNTEWKKLHDNWKGPKSGLQRPK